jgi:hypothetical protein
MGLKPGALSAVGQLDSTCTAPHRGLQPDDHGEVLGLHRARGDGRHLGVARCKLTHLKTQTLKPGYHISGSTRVGSPGAFRLWV